MNKKNLDQALAALSDALTSQEIESALPNPLAFIKTLPNRSISGDQIFGGKILKFASAGITDQAETQQLLINNNGVIIKNFAEGFKVAGNVEVENATVKVLKAEVIEADKIVGDISFEKDTHVTFNKPGKGLIWTGMGYTKQLVFNTEPDRLFSSETIDLQKGKHFSINGIKIINESELGPTITKSNLREVGRLKGLIVDGAVSIDQYIYYNSSSNRLGLGTEEPNAALSVAEDAIEVMLGTRDSVRGIVGTFASTDFDIVTDNTSRISVTAGGNIQLGNTKTPPIQVSIHGKLAVKVNMPDPEVDLHVNGPIKFNGRLHKYGTTYPIAGAYNAGDIIWNIEPKINQFVGWVCVQAGDPGIWSPFGKIGT